MKNKNSVPFKQAVKSHYESKGLSDEKLDKLSKLSEDFSTESKVKNKSIYTRWSLPISAVAASLIIAMVFLGVQREPEIITAAYNDILQDANLSNGYSQVQKDWIRVNNILPAPTDYNVEMSKFCNINGVKTTHLRIAGTHQGKMNVFFKKGNLPYRLSKSSGKTENMHWKVLESNKDITVIVMYTEDMRENVVNKIIGVMLPDLVA